MIDRALTKFRRDLGVTRAALEGDLDRVISARAHLQGPWPIARRSLDEL